MTGKVASWRDRYTEGATADFDGAIDQLIVDLSYENESARLSESVKRLRQAGQLLAELRDVLTDLSPIARAAVNGKSDHSVKFRRAAMESFIQGLHPGWSDLFEKAADDLERAHSPLPEMGQGSGSAAGRDSDLRAVALKYGKSGFFRSPKDKFAVHVIRLVCRHNETFNPAARGAAAELESFLNQLWADFCQRFQERPNMVDFPAIPNWKRAISVRHHIAKRVQLLKLRAERASDLNETASSVQSKRRTTQTMTG